MPWLLVIAALIVIAGLPTVLKILGTYLLLVVGVPVLVVVLAALWLLW